MNARLAIIAIIVAASRIAHADVVTQVRGVELTVPDDWTKRDDKISTLLQSPRTKGRVIEVIDLPSMPRATPAGLANVMGNAGKLVIRQVDTIDHAGTPIITAQGEFVANRSTVAIHLEILPVQDHAEMVLSFVTAGLDPAIAKANDDILISARVAGARLSVQFAPPTTRNVAGAPREFVQRMRELVVTMDGLMRFPRAMPIRIVQCGKINAFYAPEDHSITICHELFDYFRGLFHRAGIAGKEREELAVNTVWFSFFHEFGHALVGEFGLPIVGKGEDAADEVATLILAPNENGQKVALAAAAAFQKLASEHEQNAFADEHSLDAQRVVSIVCLLYGADAKYQQIAQGLGMTADRLAKCKRDWADRNKAWDKLMEPYTVKR